MSDHSTRRQFLGVTATGLTALSGCTDAISGGESTIPEPRHYFPRDDLQSPSRSGVKYTVIRPVSTTDYPQFNQLTPFFRKQSDPLPPGLDLGDADQYFRSFEWVGIDIPLDRGKLTSRYADRGYETVESYRGYEILESERRIVGIADGRVIQSRVDDLSTSAIKRAVNRVESKRDVKRIDTFDGFVDDVVHDYWATVDIRAGSPWSYPGFESTVSMPQAVAQFIEPTEVRLRCTTQLRCDLEVTLEADEIQEAIAEEGNLQHFTYTWPSVEVDGRTVTISEELLPFDLPG